ncbi:hypothetical protein [Amycolatopsis solani]|nr:hypothetical protein [Amycolatopsis sp. MEP2-6]
MIVTAIPGTAVLGALEDIGDDVLAVMAYPATAWPSGCRHGSRGPAS